MSVSVGLSQAIEIQFAGSRTEDTLLHKAAFQGDLEVLRENISHPGISKEDIDQKNLLCCTPLRLAATGGYTHCAQLLLDYGASIDIPDVKGQTPLHVAVKNGHLECSRLLLERGADPNGDNRNRSTPLSLAAMQGNLELVQLLLDYNAAVVLQRKGSSGLNFTVDALQLAVVYQHYDCLKALMISSVDPPAFTSVFTGTFYPYHVIVYQKGQKRFTELLYEFGLSPWVKDDKGRYAWEAIVTGPDTSELNEFFTRVLAEPRPLRSFCRLTVWRYMLSQRKSIRVLRNLTALPQTLLHYLTYTHM